MLERPQNTPQQLESEGKRMERLENEAKEGRAKVRDLTARMTELGFDSLTGLLNRKQFEENIQALLPRPGEEQRANLHAHVSLVFADVDDFKHVNDSFGHDKGDLVLRAIADTLRGSVRPGTLVGRLGGEEIGIAIPGATEEQAAAIAEELRQKVANIQFPGITIKVTASFGVATSDIAHPRTLEDLIKSADIAMYFSKQNGRNRVTTESGREAEVSRQGELDV